MVRSADPSNRSGQSCQSRTRVSVSEPLVRRPHGQVSEPSPWSRASCTVLPGRTVGREHRPNSRAVHVHSAGHCQVADERAFFSLAASLRPGNVPSADDWDDLLMPEIDRQQGAGRRVAFRADAAFARPAIYEALEQRDVDYAIRMPANKTLELAVEDILFRPPGRPSCKPLVRYKSFRYQAKSWTPARRIVAKVEHHRGELFPRVGFIVTNMVLPSRSVVRFYNTRGTAEQWIKEGKQATHWTRLSCHRFRANEVRLQLSVLAYNLGNLWRRLVLPPRIKRWSLTSLQQRLVKTGGRLVKHARYYWLLLAEGHLTRRLFGDMLRRIWALPVPAG